MVGAAVAASMAGRGTTRARSAMVVVALVGVPAIGGAVRQAGLDAEESGEGERRPAWRIRGASCGGGADGAPPRRASEARLGSLKELHAANSLDLVAFPERHLPALLRNPATARPTGSGGSGCRVCPSAGPSRRHRCPGCRSAPSRHPRHALVQRRLPPDARRHPLRTLPQGAPGPWRGGRGVGGFYPWCAESGLHGGERVSTTGPRGRCHFVAVRRPTECSNRRPGRRRHLLRLRLRGHCPRADWLGCRMASRHLQRRLARPPAPLPDNLGVLAARDARPVASRRAPGARSPGRRHRLHLRGVGRRQSRSAGSRSRGEGSGGCRGDA